MNPYFLTFFMGYPLCCSLGRLIIAKRMSMEGKRPASDTAHGIAALIELVTWIWISTKLYT